MVTISLGGGNNNAASNASPDATATTSSLKNANSNNNKNNSSSKPKTAALTANGKPKEKRRNNEKRKEKSRDAARCRRSRETEIFNELAQVLPLKKEDVNQLDKASIMRVAIAFLKIRDMLQLFPKIQALADDLKSDDDSEASQTDSIEDQLSDDEEKFDLLKCPESGYLLKQTLNGFLLILSSEGDITYVSENICEYLGITKIDILGQPIWEYTHQCDHSELKDALNLKRNGLADKIKDENMEEEGLTTHHRDLFVRFKCTLTSRGRSINIKSASYKVIHLTGHLVVNNKGDQVFVMIGSPIPHPSNIEIPLGTTTFLTKHSLDMKFTYVDDKMYSLLSYKPEDLLQTSLYSCHHGGDSDSLLATFKSVLSKGQGETSRYRFLGKYGGYCWLVTQATIVYDKLKPQSVVCVNYVVSQLENNNEIYSLAQYEESNKKLLEETKQIAITTNTSVVPKENSNSNNSNDNKIDETSEQANENDQKELQQQKALKILKSSLDIDTNTSNSSNLLITNNNNNNKNKIENKENSIEQSEEESNEVIKVKSEPLTTTKIVYKPLPASAATTSSNFIQQPQRSVNLEKRPKSVTASVFKVAPALTSSNSFLQQQQQQQQQQTLLTNITNTNINNHLLLPSINTTKTNTAAILAGNNIGPLQRAQSVTASVLSPLSQLTQKNLANIVRPITTTTTTAALFAQQHQQQQAGNRQNQNNQNSLQQGNQLREKPQAMNKGFLSFAEDVRESTMLKEEPDDLSHMTTATVDACLPLDETSPFFNEMLGSYLGPYSNLLPDEINSLDSTTYSNASDVALTTSNNCNNNKNSNNYSKNHRNNNPANITSNNCGNIDPFITYRDESNDTNCSQHLLSPSVNSKSPDGSSLPSLCSPHSLCQDEDFTLITMTVDDDIELKMRAPYIPMDEQDDLPLLTNDNKDIMWPDGSSAFTVEELNLHKDPDTLHELALHHQQQQQYQHHNSFFSTHQEQHFSNSLCSSPASSTISSLSPGSPLQNQIHHQQHQHHHPMNNSVFCSDTSELAALLGGTGNGTLSILNNNNCSGNNNETNNSIGGIVNNIVNSNQQQQQQQHQQQQQQTLNFRIQDLSDLNDLQQQQQQQHQQQNHLLNLNINCKKENFDNSNSLGSNLCDSIEDAFDNVYDKESSNVDCWSELLQLSVADQNTNSSSSLEDCKQQMQQLQQLLAASQTDSSSQQQQQQQQNLIINAVPLITIQNNKNILLQTQQGSSNGNNNGKMLMTDDMLIPSNDFITSSKNLTNNNNNNQNNNANKLSSIKLVNGGASPLASKATIRLIENKNTSQQTTDQQMAFLNSKNATLLQHATLPSQQPHHQQANKRHLSILSTANSQVESKRLKSNNDLGSLSSGSNVLQQIVNCNELNKDLNDLQKQHLQQKSKNLKNSPSSSLNLQQQMQQQQSNSVLKNLLVSGRDDPMLIDGSPLESVPISPPTCVTSSLIKPLTCFTANALRHACHNPMIGGPGLLLSPPFNVLHNDDSNPPGLTACENESTTDSGIEDLGLNESLTTISQKEKPLPNNELRMKATDDESIQHVNTVPPVPVSPAPPPQNDENINSDPSGSSRKSSLSFLDNSNPLLTSFLMELCNDDYNMSTEGFLADTELEQVLGNWPTDVA